jgi:hypothetical protein
MYFDGFAQPVMYTHQQWILITFQHLFHSENAATKVAKKEKNIQAKPS